MSMNIQTVDRDTLVDIKAVKIDPTLPHDQRIADYIRQVKNPYCYLDDGIIVKISFAETSATLEDRLLSFLQRMIE